MASIEQAPVIPLGMMVETPAAVLMCDAFAQRVDFYSIGTNDLAELVLGLARDTSLPPEELYYQPALFRMLSRLVCATSLPVTVCGEIGARLDLLPVLLGLGIRQFSMPPASLYKCAMAIPDLEIAVCEALCAKVLQANSVGELRALLDENK